MEPGQAAKGGWAVVVPSGGSSKGKRAKGQGLGEERGESGGDGRPTPGAESRGRRREAAEAAAMCRSTVDAYAY